MGCRAGKRVSIKPGPGPASCTAPSPWCSAASVWRSPTTRSAASTTTSMRSTSRDPPLNRATDSSPPPSRPHRPGSGGGGAPRRYDRGFAARQQSGGSPARGPPIVARGISTASPTPPAGNFAHGLDGLNIGGHGSERAADTHLLKPRRPILGVSANGAVGCRHDERRHGRPPIERLGCQLYGPPWRRKVLATTGENQLAIDRRDRIEIQPGFSFALGAGCRPRVVPRRAFGAPWLLDHGGLMVTPTSGWQGRRAP